MIFTNRGKTKRNIETDISLHFTVCLRFFFRLLRNYNENQIIYHLNATTRSKIHSKRLVHLKIGVEFLVEELFTDGKKKKKTHIIH